MKKIILEEINRVREIMGLSLITESTSGPKPRTFGGLLYSVLANEFKDITSKTGKQKIEQEYANIGKGKSRKETRQVADELEGWAKEVTSGRDFTVEDFDKMVSKYFNPKEKITLVRNIARNSSEVMENYIVAATQYDQKIYDEFTDMVSQGFSLSQQETKDYITRLAEANSNLYDTKTLETIWSDIESGQFKYADEAGITVPKREEIQNKSKSEKPPFTIDAENIRNTSDEDVIKIMDDIEKRPVEAPQEITNTAITKYLEKDLRFNGLPPEEKNKIIEEIQKSVNNQWPQNFKKYENMGKQFEQISEAIWSQKLKPSEKQKIIEKAFDDLAIEFNWTISNAWEYLKRSATLKNPKTGQFIWNNKINWSKRFGAYLIWNLIILTLESIYDFGDYQNENPDAWGEDWLERFNNFYNPLKISRVFIPLPAAYSLAVSKGIQAVGGAFTPDKRPPAKDELIKNPNIKNQFKAEGNIVSKNASESPDMDGDTSTDKFAIYLTDSQGNNYGLWTYNTNTDKVEIYMNPIENAKPLSDSTIVKNITPPTIDEFKTWFKSNTKFKTDDDIKDIDFKIDPNNKMIIILTKSGKKPLNYEKVEDGKFEKK